MVMSSRGSQISVFSCDIASSVVYKTKKLRLTMTYGCLSVSGVELARVGSATNWAILSIFVVDIFYIGFFYVFGKIECCERKENIYKYYC